MIFVEPDHLPYMIEAPWPESINHYFENAARTTRTGKAYVGRYLSAEAKRFRGELLVAARRGHLHPPFLAGRLSITVLACPPLRRKDGKLDGTRRDLDNLWKCLLDALTHAGVIRDDVQFDDERMIRGNRVAEGRLWVAIDRFDQRAAFEALTEAGIRADEPVGENDLFGGRP